MQLAQLVLQVPQEKREIEEIQVPLVPQAREFSATLPGTLREELVPLVLQAPRETRVTRAKMAPRGKMAARDPRATKETLATRVLLVLLVLLAQLGVKDPLGLLVHQALEEMAVREHPEQREPRVKLVRLEARELQAGQELQDFLVRQEAVELPVLQVLLDHLVLLAQWVPLEALVLQAQQV